MKVHFFCAIRLQIAWRHQGIGEKRVGIHDDAAFFGTKPALVQHEKRTDYFMYS